MGQRISAYALVSVAFIAMLAVPLRADAYPWMNRHQYPNCGSCHADPSGAGLLTEYGRAQSMLLLSSRFGQGTEEEEPSSVKDFLFGAVELPDQLLVGAWLREGYLWNVANGQLVDRRPLQMRADLAAQLKVGSLRVSGSIGMAVADARFLTQQAALTSNSEGANLVSREHWIGWDMADDAVLLRAGRVMLPFGLRITEHTAWVRSETRTDINQAQQHGIAVAFNSENIRAEAMLVAGNLQVRPDSYRERGFVGYAELHASPGYDFGISALALRSETDLATRRPILRQSYGLFGRVAPIRPLALLIESDLLVASDQDHGTEYGVAGLLQTDLEPWQGLHFAATSEVVRRARADSTFGWGQWGTVAWFFVPHMDVRGDIIRRVGQDAPATLTYLVQLHGYL